MTLSTNMTTSAILAIYNENADKLGKAKLATWKASKLDLIMRTTDLINEVAKQFEQPVRRDTNATEKDVKKEIVKRVVNSPKPAPSTKKEIQDRREERRNRPAKEKTTINAWCVANGINPKIARAKLRRAGFNAPYGAAAFNFLKDGKK